MPDCQSRQCYPQRTWYRCLARAEELDTALANLARYAAIDAAEYRSVTVAYYERLVRFDDCPG
jgi:hypothetical protein